MYPHLESYSLNNLCDELGIALNHHNSGSDSHATAKLLLQMINDGLDVSPITCIYEFIDDGNDDVSYHHGHFYHGSKSNLSVTSVLLADLKHILTGITQDGILDENEFNYLLYWIKDHTNLCGNYPYDHIYEKILQILEDGVVEPQERNELELLCESTLNPVPSESSQIPSGDIRGLNIVLTGDFSYGSREDVTTILTQLGASVKNGVTAKTDIVVVGELGSAAWVAGNYGTKVKKALELQSKGHTIKILTEKDFFSSFGRQN